MPRTLSTILFALALLAFAGSAAAASALTAGAEAEPVAEVVALSDHDVVPLCAEPALQDTETPSAPAVPNPAEPFDAAAVAASLDYGLCSLSCKVCYSSYGCPYGEWCMAVHHCPR